MVHLGNLVERDAELAVLGACMFNGAHADLAADNLKASDFGIDSHRLVFEAILKLASSGKATEEKLVASQLKSMGVLDKIGGRTALAEMITEGVGVEALEDYLETIKNASIKRSMLICSREIEDALKGDMSAQELLDRTHSRILELSLFATKETYEPVGDILARQMELILRSERDDTGISTGFFNIDHWKSGGFRAGEFVIIAARPGVGKSSLCTTLAKNFAFQKKSVAFFTLEVGRDMVTQNILCGIAGVNSALIRARRLSAADRDKLVKAQKVAAELPLLIDDSSALDIMSLRSRARQIKHKHGLDVIIVDYLQLMAGKREKLDNRQVEVSNISRGLKLLAKELNIPIIAACQLNRDAANEPPRLSHLRESGSLEQDADDVFLLHVQEKSTKDEAATPEGFVQVILAKQRSGPTGICRLKFDKRFSLFMNENDTAGFQ